MRYFVGGGHDHQVAALSTWKLILLRKAGVISILTILLYTQLGYYGQFVIQQWVLKEEAREAWIGALPDRCFFRVRLVDINTAGHWEEEGKECWYNNHLYDVIRRKTEGGSVWLYCMDDQREARLIRQSGEMTHANHDQPDKKAGHSLSLQLGDWLAATISIRVSRPAVPVRYSGFRPRSLSVGYTEIVVPPPKV
jgi:hypothetical protein